MLSYLHWAKVLPLDEKVMRRFAGLRGFLRRAGMRIPDNDLLVAATALHFELVLVTRNVRHFERIVDLELLPMTHSSL